MDVKNQNREYRRRFKPFDELTIADDFMFGAVMSNSRRIKPLLEYTLGIKIKKIEYLEKQKTLTPKYDAKGIRLDLIVVDDRGVVYNVEIQTCSSDNLPKRIRYYHDVLDLNLLKKGADYETLNKTYVIFVCTFDFFKKDRYVYTFKRQCQEDPEIYLADEATTVILNARGKIGEVGEELKNALRYISGQTPKGRENTDIRTGSVLLPKNPRFRLASKN